MKTKNKIKIEVSFCDKNTTVTLLRNYVPEVMITHATKDLYNFLAEALVDEKDYLAYLKFFDLDVSQKEACLISWLFNFLSMNEDREILNHFRKAFPVPIHR